MLCGTLNPSASAKVGSYFAYNAGPSCTGGSRTPAEEEVEGQDIEVSGEATGLQPGTEYTYCLVATNHSGETSGQPVTFTTAGARRPEAPITEVCGGPALPGSFRFCGTLNPHASATTGYYFAYNIGQSCTGANKTPASEEIEGQDIEVSGEAVGLQPDTEYAYCLVATNPAGETLGQTLTFTTEPQRPAILSETTSAIAPTGATLEAQVNPDNQETGYSFQYGTDESLGDATSLRGGNLAGGFGTQIVSASVGGALSPSTTYYYRVIATNATGTADGAIRSFVTTAAAQQTPTGDPAPSEGNNGAAAATLPLSPAPVTPTTALPAVTAVTAAKPLTNSQKLEKAMKLCKRQPKRRRAACEKLARKKYASRFKATKPK